MKTKVVHLTTAHARNEIRVFLRECCSLSSIYEVNLIVADGQGAANSNQVSIHGIEKPSGRLERMLIAPFKMLFKSLQINADVYHFHEPELLLIALFLKICQKKVIYDSHEDFPRVILDRNWIPKPLRKIVSRTFELFENVVVCKLDGIVAATPHIQERFVKLNPNTVNINNLPVIEEIRFENSNQKKEKYVCYQGAISESRGVFQMLKAIQGTKVNLLLAGPIEVETKCRLGKFEDWKQVQYLGKVSRSEVKQAMAKSIAGLLIFHPHHNHIFAMPNKMFEYMAASLPIIASNFPIWQKIIEQNNCGICVDPLSPDEITNAINWIEKNPESAKLMGQNGQKAVLDRFNWSFEEKKLLEFYSQILRSGVR